MEAKVREDFGFENPHDLGYISLKTKVEFFLVQSLTKIIKNWKTKSSKNPNISDLGRRIFLYWSTNNCESFYCCLCFCDDHFNLWNISLETNQKSTTKRWRSRSFYETCENEKAARHVTYLAG